MSNTHSGLRDARLVARADQETQQFIAQAAELAGMSMSQFLIDSARARAEEVLDRTTRIKVSVETGSRILSILDREPQKPKSKLLKNALDYKETINDSETNTHPRSEEA